MMVTAFATGLRLTLSALEAKGGNEVQAAFDILGLIDIKGAIITGDALHCNRGMAKLVVERGADYVLCLEDNQSSLLSDARASVAKVEAEAPTAKTEDKGHGRVETRRAIVADAGDLGQHHEFAGLEALGRIESTRVIDGKTETDVRYFALSKVLRPAELLAVVRSHWQIENARHWHLDVTLSEDYSRTRKDHGPANLAVIRRLALNVLRADNSKGRITAKIKRAGWNENFLLQLIGQTR